MKTFNWKAQGHNKLIWIADEFGAVVCHDRYGDYWILNCEELAFDAMTIGFAKPHTSPYFKYFTDEEALREAENIIVSHIRALYNVIKDWQLDDEISDTILQ